MVNVAASADAYIRGGTNANRNYGNLSELTVRNDRQNSNDYETFLQFDLSSVAGEICHDMSMPAAARSTTCPTHRRSRC